MEGAALWHGAVRCRAYILDMGGDGRERVLVSGDLEIRRLGNRWDNCWSVDSQDGVRSWCRPGERAKGKEGDLNALLSKATQLRVSSWREEQLVHDFKPYFHHLRGPRVRLAGAFLTKMSTHPPIEPSVLHRILKPPSPSTSYLGRSSDDSKYPPERKKLATCMLASCRLSYAATTSLVLSM